MRVSDEFYKVVKDTQKQVRGNLNSVQVTRIIADKLEKKKIKKQSLGELLFG